MAPRWRSTARRVARAFSGSRPHRILAYRGLAGPDGVRLRGRVIRQRPLKRSSVDDTVWRNARRTWSRFVTADVPGARVEVRIGDDSAGVIEVRTDDSGIFECLFVPDTPLPEGTWQQACFRLLEPEVSGVAGGAEPVVADSDVLVPSADARYAVVSDIDDTILHSSATNPWQMVRHTITKNALTRRAPLGTACLYRCFRDAAPRDAHNPVVYLSNSAWNLHDLLDQFIRHQGFPRGPILLQDVKRSGLRIERARHGEHKIAHLDALMDTWPLPLVLIGDTGQLDASIYLRSAERHPERVAAIYLRDVGDGARTQALQPLVEDAGKRGIPLLITDDPVAMAEHAVAIGLLDPSAVDLVQRARTPEQG